MFPKIYAKKKEDRPIPRSSGRVTMAAPSRERTGRVFLWKSQAQLFLEKQSMFEEYSGVIICLTSSVEDTIVIRAIRISTPRRGIS
jgi:hypothetical protein